MNRCIRKDARSRGFVGTEYSEMRVQQLLSTCVRQHVHPQPHAVLEVFATVFTAVALLLVVQPPVERQTHKCERVKRTGTRTERVRTRDNKK